MQSNIRKLRTEWQMSQADLAIAIGKTQQTISHMERDRNSISVECLIDMADYFGVSTDYILGREEDISPGNGNKKVSEESEIIQKAAKELMATAKVGDCSMIYQLILSLLLCSLEEQVQSL